jgi:S-formylglutathione hydrolase FrmB
MAVFSGSYYSKARKGMLSFNAILPVEAPTEMFDAGDECYVHGPFQTIYLLHGYTGNQNDWLIRFRIEEWAMKMRCAVIMPAGGNLFYLDIQDTQERCGEFIGRELIDVTRKLFPLSARREDTAIGGLSMGGFGAIRNGLKYADTFGSIIALSSALITDEVAVMKEGDSNAVADYAYYRHIFGDLTALRGSSNDPKHLAAELVRRNAGLPRLFIACGTEDFLYQQNLDFHRHLEQIHYPHTWRPSPGIHDFDFWNRTMLEGMRWLDGKM